MSVRLEIDGRVATLVLDRPPLNVLDLAAIAELERVLEDLAARSDDVHVAVVRGAGERAFCAGVAIEDHTPDKIGAMLDGFHRALLRLETLDTVTVAAVDRHCLGGGMELASACDLIAAADRARFGQPEIALGCYPPYAAARYPRRLGAGRAADLVLTGRTIDATEAERIGFVARRGEPGQDLDAVLDGLLDQLLAHSGAALRLAKRALRAGAVLDPTAALAESERLYRQDLAATDDLAEGVAAFLAKRPPRWRHR